MTRNEIKAINAHFRQIDDSHLWPICGRFNATERAIKRVQKLRKDGLIIDDPAEYSIVLENEISQIVNNSY